MTENRAHRERWLERVRATWDERSAWWDDMSEQNAAAPDREIDLERTIARLNLQPGDRIYDAGCGSGQFAIAFAERGFIVTAADLAPEMIERARQHAQNRAVTVDWRVGDLQEAIRPGERFEAIHARMTLQFVPDLPRTLQRFERALAPGGHLYASVPGATSPIYGSTWKRHLSTEPLGINYVTPWDLERVLEHFGWIMVDQWSGDHLAGDIMAATEQDRRIAQTLAHTWAMVLRRKATEA